MGLVYQTLGFVRALTSLVVFFALAYALWGDLERREVRAWVAAFGCTLIGASLYLIPEAGPGAHLGNFLGRNSFLALSAGLQWVGSAWLHPGSRKRPWAALLPLALLGFLLLFLRDTFPGRALAFSLAVSPFLLGAAVHLHRIPHAPARGHARAAALLLGLHSAFYLLRGVAMKRAGSEADMMLWVALSFGVALLVQSALAFLIGMVLLSHPPSTPLPGGPAEPPVD